MFVQNISKTVFGSAVAAFGFSLGKDVYNSTTGKKNNGDAAAVLLAITLFCLAAGLFFTSGLLLARNQRHPIIRIIAVVFAGGLIFATYSVYYWFFFNQVPVETAFNSNNYLLASAPWAIIFLGILFGFFQRKKRKLAWAAEIHNQNYLNKLGFKEEDEILVDKNGQKYRVQKQTEKQIELFAIGRRNRRGYFKLDDVGKIIKWSGMVKI